MAEMTNREPHLTARQREILERIARGRTNGEIADELGIGFETVKMHVSHTFAELGVSSREEAADWWRAGRRPMSRLRAILPGLSAAKLIAGGAAVLAVGAAGAVGIALASSGGSPGAQSGAPPPPGITQTSATRTPDGTPPPTPAPIGYAAAVARLHFALVEFRSDALHTSVTIDTFGPLEQFRETGDPQVWITDTTGRQTLLANQRRDGSRWSYSGEAIANAPGAAIIEVKPARANVAPPLAADQPIPAWATFTAPGGFTDELITVPLPNPNRRPLETGSVVVDQVLKAGDEVRVILHAEDYGGPDVFGLYLHTLLFDEVGRRIGQGGAGAPTGTGGAVAFLGLDSPGPKTLLVRIDDPFNCLHDRRVTPVPLPSGGFSYPCPAPSAQPPPDPETLSDYRKLPGVAAEFEIDLP